jgi:hypothetical protein
MRFREKTMRTRLTLHPDQDGAKHLREQYGEQLVCVRYRYDETREERWKTVELIIEKSAWKPPRPKWQEDTLVALQVAAQEREVRQKVKTTGGKWNPKKVVWELSYGQVVALGLTDRIVPMVRGEEQGSHLHVERSWQERPSTHRSERPYILGERSIYK